MKNLFKISLIAFSILFLISCKEEDKNEPKPAETGSVKLYFDTQILVDNVYSKLNLDNSGIAFTDTVSALSANAYTNAAGNKYTVNQVRYWVSNVVLYTEDGKSYAEPNSYHLVEYTPTASKEAFTVSGVPVGHYTKISYSIGVDSVPNHDLTKKAGDLDEKIGMSWTWDTGYIFFKMEGRFERTNGSKGYYWYHIGLDGNYKTLTQDFPEHIVIEKSGIPSVHFKTNINAVFGLPSGASDTEVLDLNKVSAMHGGASMAKVAGNYTNAGFVIDHVHGAHDH